MRCYDLWNGTELKAVREDRRDTLTFPLEANGFGAVLATPSTSAELDALLHKMQAPRVKPLSSFSHKWVALPQEARPIETPMPSMVTQPLLPRHCSREMWPSKKVAGCSPDP
jgi:hypothetical protein